MENIYFLGGELWLKNRIISVRWLHGLVTTVICCRRRLFLKVVFSVKCSRPRASAGQQGEAAVGLRPIVSVSGCRAVQVSWFKGCSLRQEIVSCSEVYCNKVHSPGGMCCWAHESLYGLAVLTSALWFIHAIPQQEWQKCNRRMVFPASPCSNPDGPVTGRLP